MIGVVNYPFSEKLEYFNSRNEAVAQAELERHMMKVRQIPIHNKEFLDNVTNEIVEKESLL